jgi:choline-sulfatase
MTSDHGEFLGDRDLWFKRSFFEQAIRVPFVVSWPGSIRPARIQRNASLVDLLPTLYEFASGDRLVKPAAEIDGASLVSTLGGQDPAMPDVVLAEILCETTSRPEFMVRRGKFKYIACDTDPPQLFDLSADPDELRNLGGLAAYRETEQQLAAIVSERWNADTLACDVVASQERRRFVSSVLGKGAPFSWDFQPDSKAATKYYRARASADAGILLRRAISASIVTIEGGTYLHEGRVLGRDAAAAEAFLRTEPETANAVERQVTEAVGFL